VKFGCRSCGAKFTVAAKTGLMHASGRRRSPTHSPQKTFPKAGSVGNRFDLRYCKDWRSLGNRSKRGFATTYAKVWEIWPPLRRKGFQRPIPNPSQIARMNRPTDRSQPAPRAARCRVRGCRECPPVGTGDQFICRTHYAAADETARQAWHKALHDCENTDRSSAAWPAVARRHRAAWASLLDSAKQNTSASAHKAQEQTPRGPRSERKAMREKAMSAEAKKQAGIKATRQRGPVPLARDPQRYELAVFSLFSLTTAMEDAEAGRLTALLLGPVQICPLASIADGWFGLSGTATDHRLTNKKTGRENYCERLSGKAAAIFERALSHEQRTGRTSGELAWLTHSMACLAMAFAEAQDPVATNRAFAELDQLGWRRSIAEMRDRWDIAMRSNFAPADQSLIDRALHKLRDHPRNR